MNPGTYSTTEQVKGGRTRRPSMFHVCKNVTDMLREQCGDMGSVQQFYLQEDCVRDVSVSVSAGGKGKEAAQAALVSYCRAVHDADECVFSDYIDATEYDRKHPTHGSDVFT